MESLTLTMHDDPVLLYSLQSGPGRLGEVHVHVAHASILRIGREAWWLADDVGTALHAAGASVARRAWAHLVEPRRYSLRADGGEHVLARAAQRWRWSTKEDGMVCEIRGVPRRIRSLGVSGGRFAFEDEAGAALAELQLTGGRSGIRSAGLMLPLPEAAFVLYATHRMFGRDVRAADGYE
jgi:hypothetical protein